MAEYFVGVISGTSADAIDCALVDFATAPLRLVAARAFPLPDALRAEIRALAEPGGDEIERLGRLDVALGREIAGGVERLLAEAGVAATEVAALGCHGQTLRHRPELAEPFTLQVGDPNTVAARTGLVTVADFRRMDLAYGGQGAPLVPAFHAAVLRTRQRDRAILNLGGIANLTLLPADPARPVTGFDSGPANALLDAWIERQRGLRCDADGAWARSGRCDEALLGRLLDDPYFARRPPKSTGREHFHLGWLAERLAARDVAPADVQATLVELTAVTVADALRDRLPADGELLACGGGVHNGRLLERLAARLGRERVATTADAGLPPDWVEACAFAWLARQRLAERPGGLGAVTGAARDAILGAVYRP